MSGDARPDRVRLALDLAQAEYELAGLRRRLCVERWVSIFAVGAIGAIAVLAVLPCAR